MQYKYMVAVLVSLATTGVVASPVADPAKDIQPLDSLTNGLGLEQGAQLNQLASGKQSGEYRPYEENEVEENCGSFGCRRGGRHESGDEAGSGFGFSAGGGSKSGEYNNNEYQNDQYHNDH